MDIGLISICNMGIIQLQDHEGSIQVLGYHRWCQYVDALLQEIRYCERVGWQFEPTVHELVEDATIWI